jgi:hypothetical protein
MAETSSRRLRREKSLLQLALHSVHRAVLENDERLVARNVLTALAAIVDSSMGRALVREVDALLRPV